MESISLAKQNKETTPPTQEELRAKLTERLYALKPIIEAGMDEYRKALKDGTFEDQDEETEGTGEKRKLALQKKLTDLVNKAEKMRDKLDSGEDLTQTTQQIEATYAHPDGKQETITIDIEAKLENFVSFYRIHSIDLPKDFEDTIREIWNNNQTEIQETIEKMGFDEILIIPPNIKLDDTFDKEMTKDYEKKDGTPGDPTKWYIKKEDIISDSRSSKPRIVFVHRKEAKDLYDTPETIQILKETLGKKFGAFKPEECLTIEEYFIFQRKYFEETGTHLDEKGYTWLPGSKSGSRVVYARWNPDYGQLFVSAFDAGRSDELLGCRLSRSFE